MNIFGTMEISASGLTAQRQRLNVIAENLANSQVTRTPEGGPYLRKHVILESQPAEPFGSLVEASSKVAVTDIVQTKEGLIQEYDPSNPDANAEGLVTWPNINPVQELVSLMLASRAFEANVAAFRSARTMALKALEIGR